MANHPNLIKNPNATVTSVDEFNALDSSVTTIIIDNGVSEPEFTQLDLTRFTQLKSLVIGQRSFAYVETVNITGLSALESIEIGESSFTNWYSPDSHPNRRVYVKDCPKLQSLRIGGYSFLDYSVLIIENVDALESIEFGEVEGESYSFNSASLELKSILIHVE